MRIRQLVRKVVGRRAQALFGTVALGVAATTMGVLVSATPAQAGCDGVGVGWTFYAPNRFLNGAYHHVAKESYQYASTCDGDRIYKGKIFDIYTDGSCATAVFYDPGRTVQGTSCDSAGANYTFYDQTGNSSAGYEQCSGVCSSNTMRGY